MPINAAKHIWFNGKLVPWEKATVHVLAHALHYGSNVFEGERAVTIYKSYLSINSSGRWRVRRYAVAHRRARGCGVWRQCG